MRKCFSQIYSYVFIFRLFSVSYLEQLNNDLYQAAAVGDAKMVECILSYGVSPNVHYSSLNLNVGRKNSKESTQLLLKHGAEIKARNGNNKTPLHCAAENNSTESAKLLLERDAEIEARDANNNSPLHYTVEEIAQKLRSYYSNTVQKSKQGIIIIKHL